MLPSTVAFAILAALPFAAAVTPVELQDRRVAMAKALQLNKNAQFVEVNTAPVYAPTKVECPTNITWVRPATGLGDGETNYLAQRAKSIDDAVTSLANSAGIDKPKRSPVIGLSLSGGGYRAMINAMGQVQALMQGTNGTGGWIDAVSYISGLSGGSWATATFVANGGQKPTDLNDNVWDLDVNLISPPNSSEYLSAIATQVKAKYDEGFPVQVTDIWGLALGNHLLPKDHRLDTDPNMTISGLPSTVPAFASGGLPMPIIIAASIDNPNSSTPNNAPFYEYTPFEFGTWDASNSTDGGYFTPSKWLGSKPENNTCYNGYDQLSFIAGVSSTLFNSLPFDATSLFPNTSFPFLNASTAEVATIPSPFEGYNGTENPDPSDPDLTLVDAGESDQNLPLIPLLVPARKVDAIIAFDSSADLTGNWPDGTSLQVTSNQTRNSEFKMPPVPSTNGFVNGGLNTRPVFFGCNTTDTPLIVYIPNYPYSALSNISSFSFSQAQNLTAAQLDSSMKTVTLDGVLEAWPTCLACALTDRANGYTDANRTSPCTQCFKAFCWDGQDNQTAPAAYSPTIGVPSFVQNLNLTIPKANPDQPKGAAWRVSVGKATALAAAGFAAWAAM